MDVAILFHKGEQLKTFKDIENLYSKDDFLCLRKKEKILKIPLVNIKYVKHKPFENGIEKLRLDRSIEVTILFYNGAAEKIFDNIIDVYKKDDMVCLRKQDEIIRIPMNGILYLEHNHGEHIGSSNN